MSEVDDVAPGAIEAPEAADPVCVVSYTLNETYTGTRTVETPAEDGEGTVSEEVPTNTVQVTFTDGTITHEREVNVCLDADGNYDDEAMQVRLAEVALGVEGKIAAGVIS